MRRENITKKNGALKKNIQFTAKNFVKIFYYLSSRIFIALVMM
jgi:hypothetical protein